MFKLPIGVNINNLIDDLRIFSWEAADIFLYYSQILKKPINSENIIKSKGKEDPVTSADLKVNDLIIKRINDNEVKTKVFFSGLILGSIPAVWLYLI